MGIRKLLGEFKAFAFKGNMIDLAVAVVIGAAFSGVINSLVKDIVMPTIFMATSAVKEAKDVTVEVAQKAAQTVGVAAKSSTQPTTQASTQPEPSTVAAVAPAVPPAASPPPAAAAPADQTAPKKVVELDWKIGAIDIGHFIAELLNFIIVAFAVFVIIVKLLGSVIKKVGGTPKPDEPTTRECPECLSIIPIQARRCAYCTAVVAPAVMPPKGT
ncbi:MAG TPA: MscL family protein [Tepidisphaeraceae bacterium]|jgi:large conductance mechanosensitive channel|nr:MscL family protein [Tepidisphaeraceae bacterium]